MGHENKDVERDDINSGGAVVLWPMKTGVEGNREETQGAQDARENQQGRVILSSFG